MVSLKARMYSWNNMDNLMGQFFQWVYNCLCQITEDFINLLGLFGHTLSVKDKLACQVSYHAMTVNVVRR